MFVACSSREIVIKPVICISVLVRYWKPRTEKRYYPGHLPLQAPIFAASIVSVLEYGIVPLLDIITGQVLDTQYRKALSSQIYASTGANTSCQ